MKKIMKLLKELYDKYKYSIYSSMIFTFLTHFYFFSRRLANEDDLSYLIFKDFALTSGRWNNGTLFTTSLMSPSVNFILVIIILAIISLLICDIFKIKNKKNMILISLIISTFPSLALSFSYLFMVEIYMTSLLLAVLAVWLSTKWKYGFIPGSLCIALSLGNYQSYIAVSVSLIIIYVIKETIDKKKEILKDILKLFIMGILGIIIYFIILKVLLLINKTSLSNYKGADSMGIPPISEWPKLIFRTYKHFIGYFIGKSYFRVSIFESTIRILTIILTFILLINKITKEKFYKNKTNIIIFILLIVLIPFTFNIVDFMAFKADLTSLQIYSFSSLYLLIILILDKTKSNYLNTIIRILIIAIGIMNFTTVNKYYFKQETYYKYTENFNNRLLNKIESTEGYYYGIPIVFKGESNSNFYKELNTLPNTNDNITFDQSLWGGKYIGYADLYTYNNDKKILTMINNEFGVYLNRATDEERDKIKDNIEYNNMKSYPEKDSIKIIDGILVINF